MKNEIELLTQLVRDGKIKKGDIPEDHYNEIMKNIKEQYVRAFHQKSICVDKTGRWRTKVTDPVTNKRRSIAKPTREELIDTLYNFYQGIAFSEGKCRNMRDLYPIWLEHKKLEAVSDIYPDRIEADWHKFYEKDPFIDIPFSVMDALTIEEWLLSVIKTHHLTKKAFYNMRTILSQGLKYAYRKRFIPENWMEDVEIDTRHLASTPKKDDLSQVFTKEEVERLAALAWDDFHVPGKKIYRLAPLAVLFTFYSGVRVGELTGLRFSDLEGNLLHVQRMVRRKDHKVIDHTKTVEGDRYIPLTDNGMAIIRAARSFHDEKGLKGDGYIFSEYDRPVPNREIETYFKKYCNLVDTRHKSTHCGRKTYISALIEGRVNINTVRKVAGHTDEKTTLHHYVYDRTPSKEILDAFHNALDYT